MFDGNLELNDVLMWCVTSLAAVVATLYWQTRKHFDYLLKKLDDCESDRDEQWKQIVKLGGMRPEKNSNQG